MGNVSIKRSFYGEEISKMHQDFNGLKLIYMPLNNEKKKATKRNKSTITKQLQKKIKIAKINNNIIINITLKWTKL